MTLLLMAAGSGSRYGKLKQFDNLGPEGEFLMEFAIYDAIKNNFNHIVVITKKENVDFLNNHLRVRLPQHVALDVLAQEKADLPEGVIFHGERKKPWGTAHAVWTARKVIDGSFAVINADDFYGHSAYSNAAAFLEQHPSDEIYALLGYTLKETLSQHGSVSRGVCTVEGEHLISVEERLELEQKEMHVIDHHSGKIYTGDEQVSMNFWVCKPSIFDKIEAEFRIFLMNENHIANSELYLPIIIQKMLQAGETQVKLIRSESEWFGITYASDKEKAMKNLQDKTIKKQYISPLWA